VRFDVLVLIVLAAFSIGVEAVLHRSHLSSTTSAAPTAIYQRPMLLLLNATQRMSSRL
jgi:hypothetical protein